ncbi:MAG: hypothetical protein ABIS18_02745, partial [Actinomycetota bacterium]
DQIRMAIQLASGVAEVPRRQAERLAKQLAGDLKGSSVAGIAEDIINRSRENAQLVQTLVVGEIKRQVKSMGLATRDDLDRIAKRLKVLEDKAKPRPTAKPKAKRA